MKKSIVFSFFIAALFCSCLTVPEQVQIPAGKAEHFACLTGIARKLVEARAFAPENDLEAKPRIYKKLLTEARKAVNQELICQLVKANGFTEDPLLRRAHPLGILSELLFGEGEDDPFGDPIMMRDNRPRLNADTRQTMVFIVNAMADVHDWDTLLLLWRIFYVQAGGVGGDFSIPIPEAGITLVDRIIQKDEIMLDWAPFSQRIDDKQKAEAFHADADNPDKRDNQMKIYVRIFQDWCWDKLAKNQPVPVSQKK